jgi:hypothetical protein
MAIGRFVYDSREECKEVKGILNSQWIVKKSRECEIVKEL